ncbi:DMT family transporter [Sphingomonas sp.]|uniref:DMT family transporter n=1 Tax=Sphingomonas sp. TaxID=28214 RepID=UPI00182AFBCF|nr:DMT family transporter [Sphingomonas sp.]MBA4761484.1 DMT family transporter [Sphingomonas sp.]
MTAHHPLRGASLFIFGLLLFACLDVTVKYLAARYDVPLIVAIRYACNLVLMTALLAPRRAPEMLRTKRTGWVIARALALSIGSLSIGLALQRMPVAETSAILFFAPVVVILAAGPLLGERVGVAGVGAAALGFIGVLFIVRPGGGLDPVGVLLAGVGMVTTSIYQLLSRSLARTESTIALLFYTTLTGTVIFCALAPWFIPDRMPNGFDLLLLLSLGVYGGLGHFLFTAAYRDTPASVLASLNYLQLLFVALLGWLIFAHMPDRWSMTGMAIIAASGILAAWRARRPPVKRSV